MSPGLHRTNALRNENRCANAAGANYLEWQISIATCIVLLPIMATYKLQIGQSKTPHRPSAKPRFYGFVTLVLVSQVLLSTNTRPPIPLAFACELNPWSLSPRLLSRTITLVAWSPAFGWDIRFHNIAEILRVVR
jgi:hypothetical protein